MPLQRLERQQVIAATLAEAWSFFAEPENLAAITPPWLGFTVTSPPQGTMHAGMILTYRLSPFCGLRLRWVTEITHCREPDYFVDEQRCGPYAFWHHQHFFQAVPQGVAIRDVVHYRLPFGPFGALANKVVRQKLDAIFDYRRQVVAERFAGAGLDD